MRRALRGVVVRVGMDRDNGSGKLAILTWDKGSPDTSGGDPVTITLNFNRWEEMPALGASISVTVEWPG